MHWGKGLITTISLYILLEGCSVAPMRVEDTSDDPSTQTEREASVTDSSADVRPPIEEGGSLQANRIIPERGDLWDHIPIEDRVRISSQPHLMARIKLKRTLRSSDLWERIRNGMGLPKPDRTEITSEIEWFSLKQAYFDVVADRARPYLHHIVEEVERRDMPLEIALLPIIESAYQPTAYSPKGAAGIWQFIPGTGKRFGLKENAWYDGRRDVMASTEAALDYLNILHERFDGDWLLAIAAYNCGEGAVENAIERNRRLGRSTDFWSLDLPGETQVYVPKLLAISSIVADPSEYQLTLNPIPNRPYLKEVHTGGQISLDKAAALANMTVAELRSLNPGLKGSTTDPAGPHKLVLPIHKAEKFQQRLASLSPDLVSKGKGPLLSDRLPAKNNNRKVSNKANTVSQYKRNASKAGRRFKTALPLSRNPGKVSRREIKKSGLSMR